MTTAAISVFRVAQLCDKALEAILRRIKACEEVVDVDVDYKTLSFPSSVRSLMVGGAASEHYKNLNFVLRLQEFCAMISDPVPIPKIDLSLEDFSRLITLADPTKIYSATTPYNGNPLD